uniref:Aldehyde oxidase 5 n=1 Tax=Scleropages formosus TaxID=113540 RepID=A0A8C9S671_SCLFO
MSAARLTGTKYGCGSGGCGACTVMLSRYDPHCSANACLLPVVSLHGAAVVTVEGIGSTKTKLHPVQERIAKAHGSQCGFCTPGMVMSMYTLLRNQPQPSLEDIREALTGNLCRCTGYRPIVDGFKTFCGVSECCQNGESGKNCCGGGPSTLCNGSSDVSQTSAFRKTVQTLVLHLHFQLMLQKGGGGRLCFQGNRVKWFSPADLSDLLELRAAHPNAPLVVGNTNVGPNMMFKGDVHPLIISPGSVMELHTVSWGKKGVTFGSACSLSEVKEELQGAVGRLDPEESRVFQALLNTLRCLAGKQIRNMATVGGNILSADPKYDLSCILAAADCTLQLVSKEVPLNEKFFAGFGRTHLRADEVLLSLHIPRSQPWEFVSAFRQAQRREFAFSIVNAGMKVVFKEGTDTVQSLSIFYGGMGPTLLRVKRTCEGLVGMSWNEGLLEEACRLLAEEVALPPTAHGGKTEFRSILSLSFFFKFYMQVVQELREKGVGVADLPLEYLSALKPFKNEVPQGHQTFQMVSEIQSSKDPVGRPRVHIAAFQQATGEAKYYDDLPAVSGELFVFMVTSTRAHAKIISMDFSEALRVPGAVTFLSARDVPGQNRRLWFNNTEELFAEEECTFRPLQVCCVGQIIGAVVAESREQAKRAAERVRVTYDDLSPVFFTIEEAIQHQSFFNPKRKLERGNVDEAFGKVDRILEGEMYMGGQEHFYMETQGLIAVPRGEDGEMDLYVATQHAAFTQEVVGHTLGVDSNKITCHVKRLGGGFGGKVMKIASLSAIAATAAYKTGRAVRCVLDRGDDMLITSGRHPFLGKYKVGFMNDGTILAADITYYSNGGSTLDESSFIMEKALLHMDNGYKIPNLRGHGLVCKTHLPSYTAFRGFGGPQGLTIIESILHEVAAECGLPAEEVRAVNMYSEEESYTHHRQPFCPRDMVRCWDECLEKSDYSSRRLAVQHFNATNRWRKRGICAVPLKFGIGFSKGFYNQGAALVNIYKDGSVLVSHGGTEMGQGINTKAVQIASRILGVPMSSIHIKETCTGNVPNAAPSAASFGTDAVGMAVKDACEKLMKRLEPVMKAYPKWTWSQWIVEAYCQKISLSATGFFMGPHTSVDWEKSEGAAYYYFTFGACCSEVEIDCLTGDHKNIRTDIVMDVGKSLNPALDVGQVEGGFVQGLGLYTIEELQFSPDGALRTRGPNQYKIPALCDIPPQLNVHLLADSQNPNAIYSSKGIGEPPVFFGCTLFFAIKEAIAAARRESGLNGRFALSSPATVEKIRMACVDRFTEMVCFTKPGSFTPWAINV